jgi:hypothetical protein
LAQQQTNSFLILVLPTNCCSLSSASPAHSPKEEYIIAQSTDTPKEAFISAQSEDHAEPGDDKSELTERKSDTGWLHIHLLVPEICFHLIYVLQK